MRGANFRKRLSRQTLIASSRNLLAPFVPLSQPNFLELGHYRSGRPLRTMFFLHIDLHNLSMETRDRRRYHPAEPRTPRSDGSVNH